MTDGKPPDGALRRRGRSPFLLRLDEAVLDAVKRSAAADLRSVNGQIEVLLREALARRGIRLRPPAPGSGDDPEGSQS